MRKLVLFAALVAVLAALPVAPAAAVVPQNDAGSGQDAPNVATSTFRISPGVVYDGLIEGYPFDYDDYYAFDAAAGDSLDARATGALGCVYLYDGSGTRLAFGCAIGVAVEGRATAVAATTGTYYLQYSYLETHPYRFSLGVGAEAPPTAPANIDPLASGGLIAPVAPATPNDDHVVIAVIDTGINPYHEFFGAPQLSAHASGWLPGFPASAQSVPLSLDAPDYASAKAADAATFAGLQRSTYNAAAGTFDTHLYTFPGTRVVGAVSFGEYADRVTPAVDPPPVRDDDGHGTHSAGLVAGANLRAADGNVLIVVVEVGQGTFDEGVRWAARQPWIDALSVSLGVLANAPVTFGPTGDRSGMEWATHEASVRGKPVFMASGNGFSGTGVPPDHCSTYTSPYTGPAWITRIGAAHPNGGNPMWWHCVPVDAVARTNIVSPDFDVLRGGSSASGTSAATPNAAGHFARLLLDGRRAGSTASRAGTLEHLLRSAAPAPLYPGPTDPSVYPVSLADQGYGLIDQRALDDATARLIAGAGPQPRPETEQWFANDWTLRTSLWGPGSATDEAESGDQDDAGSGGDAPNGRVGAVRVDPGVRYDGMLGLSDTEDWYAFDAVAGDTVGVALSAATACYEVVAPSGAFATTGCAAGYGLTSRKTVTATESGTWYVRIRYSVPSTYSFAAIRNGAAPTLFP